MWTLLLSIKSYLRKTDTVYTDPNLKLVSGYEAAEYRYRRLWCRQYLLRIQRNSALGYRKLKISGDEADILNADALILPGVGALKAVLNVCVSDIWTLARSGTGP